MDRLYGVLLLTWMITCYASCANLNVTGLSRRTRNSTQLYPGMKKAFGGKPVYCEWTTFYETYVKTGIVMVFGLNRGATVNCMPKFEDSLPVPVKIIKNYSNSCSSSPPSPRGSSCGRAGVAYWGMQNETNYTYGGYFYGRGRNCSYYYILFEVNDERISGKFYEDGKYNININGDSNMKEVKRFSANDYNKMMSVTVYGYPGGSLIQQYRITTPKNAYQLQVQLEARKYWAEGTDDCPNLPQQNIQVFSELFCEAFPPPQTEVTSTTKAYIKEKLPEHLKLDNCKIYFQNSLKKEDLPEEEPQIWLLVIAAILFVILVCAAAVFIAKKLKKGKQANHNLSSFKSFLDSMQSTYIDQSDSALSQGNFINLHWTKNHIFNHGNARKDSQLSIMVIHRPGCDVLDNIVRDLSFILNVHGVGVQSPLLEMSNIDAEGGIATFMQRNIHKCTHVIIFITETDKETTHSKHKPYEFTLKMLSGLAFQQQQTSRYIPVYLKDYKQILPDIPLFLIAGQNTGYTIPSQIKDLLHSITVPTPTENNNNKDGGDRSDRIQFFTDRIAKECLVFNEGRHDKCCKERCLQGILTEDASDIWSTSSFVTTTKSHHQQHHQQQPCTMNRLFEDKITWDNNVSTTAINQKVKHWQNKALDLNE